MLQSEDILAFCLELRENSFFLFLTETRG